MVASVISITFLVLAIVSILSGILRARKLYWVEAVVKTVLTIISTVLTVILTSAFALKISNALVVPVENLLSSTNVDDILKEVASAENALAIILSIIITPIFFILVFLFLQLIFTLILSRPITKLCLTIAGKKEIIEERYSKNKEDRKKKGPFCIKSAVFGSICALLCFTVLFIPVTGTMETVSSIGTEVQEDGQIHDISVALSDNVATKLMHPVAAPVWDTFGHYTVDGKEINISEEAHIVGVLIDAYSEMSSSDEEKIHHSAELFREMSALCPNSSLIPCLCADFINAASAHWLEGEDFYGISLPAENDETTGDIMSMLVQCLDHSTTETMREDLATIANVMAIIAENAHVNDEGKIDMASLFENDRVVAKLSVELLNNKRLAPVMSTLVKKQVESTGSGQIELPDKDGEEYKVVVDSIVEKYQENVGEVISEESLDTLAGAVGETLEKEVGITLSESEKVTIASTLISEFGSGTELTPEMVSDFLEQYRKQQ